VWTKLGNGCYHTKGDILGWVLDTSDKVNVDVVWVLVGLWMRSPTYKGLVDVCNVKA